MNPRVSRSSALASKATGFPIAKVAAKLAVGYTLDELANDITRVTPASFEPTIDYIVTKMPRFTFEKFPGTEPLLTTSMKSVGEAMAIGRSFAESVQKALRSMETGLSGFDEVAIEGVESGGKDAVEGGAGQTRTRAPAADCSSLPARAHDTAEIHAACQFEPWFLECIREIVEIEEDRAARRGLPQDRSALFCGSSRWAFRMPGSAGSWAWKSRSCRLAAAASSCIRFTSGSIPAPPNSRR